MNDTQRIASIRQKYLDLKAANGNPWTGRNHLLRDYNSLKASENIKSLKLKYGLRCRDRLLDLDFDIDELELLAGKVVHNDLSHIPEVEQEKMKNYLEQFIPTHGQTGHCELEFSRVFEVGIDGLRQDLQELMSVGPVDSKNENWQAFTHALNGLSGMIENAAADVKKKMEGASSERLAELEEIFDSCTRIAHQAPATFRDAIQLHWFICMGCMIADVISYAVPGHLDRTLYPFYQQGIKDGTINKEKALLLIECLYLLVNHQVPDGGAVSVMVGGRDPEGNDVSNELSYLCMEALRRTNLVYPTVGVCWHEETPQELTDLTVELISKGYSTPAFFGDSTIQKGMKSYGALPEQACNYINSTCVEITPAGSSNVWVASPYFSTCKFLLEEIESQVKSGEIASDFETFLEKYFIRLGEKISEAVDELNECRIGRKNYGGKPLQSVFTRDCIGRGMDIDEGGAVYNWVECSFVGLANLADSLYVLKEEVYGKKSLAMPDLKKIVDANFENYEKERIHFLEGYPKYGNDNKEVDSLLASVVDFAKQECAKYRMEPDNSYFIPGSFCWVMHERLGSECGATPDGRKAGFPFADGGGPAQGREKNGPTAAIMSTTSWDHSELIGGLAYNMKFNKSLFTGSEAQNRLRDLIVTFLRRGGFETQINVVDHETLKKARKNPEEYRDLVVRIGGYTDYFTRLSPQMQDEVMLRTEFSEI
jgi:formate C-acetyltransferase